MSGFRKYSIIFVIVAYLAAFGCGSSENKTSKPGNERLASVRVVRVERGDVVSCISATGTLAPKQITRLGPKIEGRIEKLYADQGDYVKKGMPLIKLEQDTYLIAKNKAIASLGTAEANLLKTEVNLENLEKEYKRQFALYQQKITSEQKFDEVAAAYKTAQADVELAQTQVKEADANLKMAEQNLKESIIYAPFSGFVVEKHMEEGEVSSWISIQWNALVLADIENVKIECPISENDISFIKPGSIAQIQVDAYPDDILTGKITSVNSQVDEKSRTFIIKIVIPNKDLKLKGGMFARVKIPKQKRSSILRIPKESLMTKGGENVVYTVQNGSAKAQKITLGISDGNFMEAVSGLKEGDLVVVEGLFALKGGTKVEIIK